MGIYNYLPFFDRDLIDPNIMHKYTFCNFL